MVLRLQCFHQSFLALLPLHFLFMSILLRYYVLWKHHGFFRRNVGRSLTIQVHRLLQIPEHQTRVDASPLLGRTTNETVRHYIRLLLLVRLQFVLFDLRILKFTPHIIRQMATLNVLVAMFLAWRLNHSVKASLALVLGRKFGISRILLVELVRNKRIKFAISYHLLVSVNGVKILFLQFFVHVIDSLICGESMLLDSSGNPLQFFRLGELNLWVIICVIEVCMILVSKSFAQEILFCFLKLSSQIDHSNWMLIFARGISKALRLRYLIWNWRLVLQQFELVISHCLLPSTTFLSFQPLRIASMGDIVHEASGLLELTICNNVSRMHLF